MATKDAVAAHPAQISTTLQFQGPVTVEHETSLRICFGRLSADELVRLYREFGRVLFDPRIHDDVSARVPIVRHIYQQPEDWMLVGFRGSEAWFICDDFDVSRTGERSTTVDAKSLQIIVGAEYLECMSAASTGFLPDTFLPVRLIQMLSSHPYADIMIRTGNIDIRAQEQEAVVAAHRPGDKEPSVRSQPMIHPDLDPLKRSQLVDLHGGEVDQEALLLDVDRKVQQFVEHYGSTMTVVLGGAVSEERLRSAALLALTVSEKLDIPPQKTFDYMTGADERFGVDALVITEFPLKRFVVTVFQAIHDLELSQTRPFPSERMLLAVRTVQNLLDPILPLRMNRRLADCGTDIRNRVANGERPSVRYVFCLNEQRWEGTSDDIILTQGVEEALLPEGPRISLPYRGPLSIEDLHGETVLRGRISLEPLVELMRSHGERLLHRDILYSSRWETPEMDFLRGADLYDPECKDMRSMSDRFRNSSEIVLEGKHVHHHPDRDLVEVIDAQIVEGAAIYRFAPILFRFHRDKDPSFPIVLRTKMAH